METGEKKSLLRVGTPLCGLVCGMVGVVIALMLLLLGFWRALFVALFFAAGYFVGAFQIKRNSSRAGSIASSRRRASEGRYKRCGMTGSVENHGAFDCQAGCHAAFV